MSMRPFTVTVWLEHEDGNPPSHRANRDEIADTIQTDLEDQLYDVPRLEDNKWALYRTVKVEVQR